MKFNLPIPEELKHLPVDGRGYPVPYFVSWIDGKPDFRIADLKKQEICIKHSKCWICGKPLVKGVYWFLGGILTLTNKIATDTAMHEACARFSLLACPHMYFEKAERREAGEIYQDAKAKNPLHAVEKPKEIFLIYADKWQAIKNPAGTGKLIDFRPVKWYSFKYENNILTPQY